MTTPTPTPATPPERILPTEDGAWWVRFGPALVRPALVNRISLPAVLGMGPTQVVASLPGHQTETPVDRDIFTWLCRIPTPERLAAMHAQLAAGKALADHLRAVDRALASFDPEALDAILAKGAPIRRQLFAAFPPAEKGGAR